MTLFEFCHARNWERIGQTPPWSFSDSHPAQGKLFLPGKRPRQIKVHAGIKGVTLDARFQAQLTRSSMTRKTQFISVEVVIKTDFAYDDFVQWFIAQGEHVSVVPCDTHRSHIYFASLPCRTPDETLGQLFQQIASLPELPRQQWDAASFREFYIGYSVGEEPFCYQEHLSCEALSSVVSLRAGIGLALYSAEPT